MRRKFLCAASVSGSEASSRVRVDGLSRALPSNPDLKSRTKRVLEEGQASRPISTGQLHTLLCFHTQPIKLVVYKWPLGTEVQGYLILGLASRLDAFSGYRFRI